MSFQSSLVSSSVRTSGEAGDQFFGDTSLQSQGLESNEAARFEISFDVLKENEALGGDDTTLGILSTLII